MLEHWRNGVSKYWTAYPAKQHGINSIHHFPCGEFGFVSQKGLLSWRLHHGMRLEDERWRHGFPMPHPLQTLQLVQGAIELPFQRGFVAQNLVQCLGGRKDGG